MDHLLADHDVAFQTHPRRDGARQFQRRLRNFLLRPDHLTRPEDVDVDGVALSTAIDERLDCHQLRRALSRVDPDHAGVCVLSANYSSWYRRSRGEIITSGVWT